MPKFEYYGPVKGQARPRFGQGRAYDRKDMKAYKAAIADAYREQVGERFEGVPLAVSVHAYRPLPKRAPKRLERQAWTTKPDADNIGKAVLDALNGVAWADDAQVVRLAVVKHDRTHGLAEGLSVYIREVCDFENERGKK